MSSAPHTADLLLYGGHVLTFDPNRPEAQAVAIAAGRILAVGTEEELRPFVSPKTQTLARKTGCAAMAMTSSFSTRNAIRTDTTSMPQRPTDP